jgi:hypothetical protein
MVTIPDEARRELSDYLAELEAYLQEVKSISSDGGREAIIFKLERLGAKVTEAAAFVRGFGAPS